MALHHPETSIHRRHAQSRRNHHLRRNVADSWNLVFCNVSELSQALMLSSVKTQGSLAKS
jgi:hypothetical protein